MKAILVFFVVFIGGLFFWPSIFLASMGLVTVTTQDAGVVAFMLGIPASLLTAMAIQDMAEHLWSERK